MGSIVILRVWDMVRVVANRLLRWIYNTHLENEEKSPPTGQS